MAGNIVDVTLRLIDRVTQPLGRINANFVESGRQWVRAGNQIRRAGQDIQQIGTSMTKNVTLPVAGVGTACVKMAADFEAGMSKVKSISNATEGEMDTLTAKAMEMGAKTKFSSREAADAFSYMAMAGWNVQEMTDGIEGVMYLAGATGEDLAQTSDIVTDAMTAFGMGAEETTRFVNVLAQAANKSNTDVAMLGESFKYVAPVAGAMKYNIEDVSTALGLMANSGIKASQAGTSLRNWISRMADPTKSVSSTMENLGISLTDSAGNMKDFQTILKETRKGFQGLSEAQKSAAAATLAGKHGMSGLLAIVNASESDFQQLSAAMYDAEDACYNMYKVANDNLMGRLEELSGAVETIAISFGNKLLPYIEKGVEWLQGMADAVNNLSEEQMDLIVKIAAFTAAAGPMVLIIGKMVSGIGTVMMVVGKLGTAIHAAGSLGAVITGAVTGPVGIAIGVALGLVAAGVLLYKNWDKVKETALHLYEVVKSTFEDLGLTSEEIQGKLLPLGEKFSELWVKAQPILTKLAEWFQVCLSVRLGQIIGVASGLFSYFLDNITSHISGIMTALDGVITFINGVFAGDWGMAWDGIVSIFSGAFQSLTTFVKAPLNAIISMINGTISGINNMGIEIPDYVPVLGGKDFKINIPKIPTLAAGTENWKGGIVQISEKGGEIVDLPSGSRVYPHDKSVQKAYQDGGKGKKSIKINIPKIADSVIIRQEADIDLLVSKLADKLEKISQNMGGDDPGYLFTME